MKRASVAAAAGLLIVVAILATFRVDPMPDPKRVPRSSARDAAANGDDAGAGAPAVEPASAPSPLPPQRTPVAESPIFADLPQITLDLRGPDDAPLDAGSIFMEGEGARNSSKRNHWRFEWTRAAPNVSWPPTAHGLHAEASSGTDDLGCHDLASGTIEVDPDLARSADPRLVVRLGLRPGIFGRVQDLAAAPSTRVVSIERSVLDGAAHPSEEIVRRGHSVLLRRRGDLDATYEIFDLEPGAYFVGLQDELGDVLEPLTSVDVADRMVRVDLTARCREDSSLRVRLIGLSQDDVARTEFVWIDGAAPNGGWSPLRRDAVDATSFRVTPIGAAARNTMQRLLAGELDPREKCALALMRNSEVFAAQPLANSQREVTFEVGPDANLAVRMRVGPERTSLRFDVVPAAAVELLTRPPSASDRDVYDGTTVTHTVERLAPGDFVLQVWAPLVSSLHHGEVWWPIERRALTLHAGDQELALDPTLLHPLTVRFDRARFGADAKVQLMLHGFEKWPRYAAPDERGVARFDDVPAGDYTVAVIGDAAGQVDCTVPETSELTVEPTRRER